MQVQSLSSLLKIKKIDKWKQTNYLLVRESDPLR